MSVDFSIPTGTDLAYRGSLDATVFEVLSPDNINPTNHIRTSQDWGVRLQWTMLGAWVPSLTAEFHVQAFIESVGPGQELALPATPDVINTLSVPVQPVNKRVYNWDIKVTAGTLKPGVYKLVTLVQLHDDAPPATPYPIVATVEGPVLTFFETP